MDINTQEEGFEEGAAVQVTVPDTVIHAKVYDGAELIADYTGASALHYPAVLASLTPAVRAQLMAQISHTIILTMAGVV